MQISVTDAFSDSTAAGGYLTLPASDELTVTADTTVEPSNIEVEYYSKRKE